MPTASVSLKPGVNNVATPTLNEMGISIASQIRFREGLVEKRGGYSKLSQFPVTGVPRTIWPWTDLENAFHVAVGSTTSLTIITNGINQDITPQTATSNITPAFATTSGSAVVTVTDTGSSTSSYDVINITTPVSIGGVVLFGYYPVTTINANSYTINAGSNATSTASGGSVPSFTSTTGSQGVVVNMVAHGKTAGSVISFPLATSVGGLVIQGFYNVISVAGANTFTINAPNSATSTATVSMNSGNVQITYYIGVLPSPNPLGYGLGGYGLGGYGTGVLPATRTGTPIATTDWTLATFGELLLACPKDGPIFVWGPQTGVQTATISPNTPPYNAGILIADQQQMVIAWGSSVIGYQDPMLIRWSDAGNYTVWNPTVTNQSGSYRLPTGNKIMGCVTVGNQILVITDTDIWSMQYIGYPSVWGFQKVAMNCGAISRKSIVKIGDSIYWMGANQFWTFSSGAVTPIECPLYDNVFPKLNSLNLDNIRGAVNSRFNEIVWYYYSADNPIVSGFTVAENNTYACYTTTAQTWDGGASNVSAWGDPYGAKSNGYIYQFETSPDSDGVATKTTFTTGYFMISDGEDLDFLDKFQPDIKYILGDPQITIELLIANESPENPRVLGPYLINKSINYLPMNIRGRMIALRFTSNDLGTFWRFGNCRFKFQPNGRR